MRHIKQKRRTKKRADEDEYFVSATFDLQRVLNIPVSDAGPVYYSRKLCVYYLTIYEAGQPNNAFCFAWTENNGNRGSGKIGTAVLEWFKTLPDNVRGFGFI